jgi:hypothetical protein
VPSTTETTLVRACSPGCLLPSDYDAVTAMASSATVVATATTQEAPDSNGVFRADLVSDRVLQGDANQNAYPVPLDAFSVVTGGTGLVEGTTYLVSMSFNRGGACLAALFSYDTKTQVATFLEQSYHAPADEILEPGRVLPIPRTMTVAHVATPMHPTGGVVYPANCVEWDCPGP